MDYIEELNKYIKDISTKHKELCDQLSEIDSEQDDILHFLELTNCDAATMMKATKKLKEVRNRRREIKNELALVQKIHTRIGSAAFTYAPSCVYSCKTEVLNGISTKIPIVTKIKKGKLIHVKEEK